MPPVLCGWPVFSPEPTDLDSPLSRDGQIRPSSGSAQLGQRRECARSEGFEVRSTPYMNMI